MLCFRSPTWVYCICHKSVLHIPPSNIKSNTGLYYISHQVYCRGHAVLQEPHLGVLHSPSSVLHFLSCKSGASLGVLYLSHRCTAYAIIYIRNLIRVYCICHQVYCICHHLTSGAALGCTTLAIKCTAEAMLCFRSLTWVYCICHLVYCISCHVNQEPHLVYCICHTGVLHMSSFTSGASLGCTALAIKCTAYAII